LDRLNLNSFLDGGTAWAGWRRWSAWAVCIIVILILGFVRIATEAEFSFASLGLFPVLFIAWTEGRRSGIVVSLLAALMWMVGDIASAREFSAAWIPWANAATRFMTYGLVALLAAQVKVLLDREHEGATEDALTGLMNRRAFLDAGENEVIRSRRYGHPLAVVFMDLDAFKTLNDSKGHHAGDAALTATAQGLRSVLRDTDRVARLGGDEFAILLPEIAYDEAVDAGRKISVAVNDALANYRPVTASTGIAWFGSAEGDFTDMLKAADQLMYEVKASGKGLMRSRQFISMKPFDSQR
jgi:diguanylate cyclase (GGDEF)-like protein